jgi:hypothetical protein
VSVISFVKTGEPRVSAICDFSVSNAVRLSNAHALPVLPQSYWALFKQVSFDRPPVERLTTGAMYWDRGPKDSEITGYNDVSPRLGKVETTELGWKSDINVDF